MLLVLLPCMEKGEGGKVGPTVVAVCKLPQSMRGVWALVRCGGDGGGVDACAVVGHRATKDQVIKTILFFAHVSLIRPF